MDLHPNITAARAAKQEIARMFGDRFGITGIGVKKSKGGYAVHVLVTDSAAASDLPKTFDGVPVTFLVVGEFHAH